jgi:hypothetical protein
MIFREGSYVYVGRRDVAVDDSGDDDLVSGQNIARRETKRLTVGIAMP